jgi:hypothetical protein
MAETVFMQSAMCGVASAQRNSSLRKFLSNQSQSQSHITTDSQSASTSWCLGPSGTRDQFFYLLEILF